MCYVGEVQYVYVGGYCCVYVGDVVIDCYVVCWINIEVCCCCQIYIWCWFGMGYVMIVVDVVGELWIQVVVV